jgi:TetR/AcrR family transcriptional regulator, transcriptional repressor for nem operon
MGNQPRTARGRATRERIVQAAAELVAERGVAGTSLDGVRERAHASKSQLYLYFSDREALLRSVAEATCETVIEGQAGVLAEFSSLAGIERYLDALVALQVDRGAHGGCPIGSLAGELVERDEGARQILAGGLERWEAGLRAGLEAMAARDELSPQADPDMLANQTLTILQGGLLMTQIRRDPGQMRLAADTVLALVRAALAPGATQPR